MQTLHSGRKFKSSHLSNRMKSLFIKIVLLLILPLLFNAYSTIYAQDNNVYYPFLKNFDRSECDAGMQTWMISQAPNGLIYFANNHGLVEFDGRNWELYGLYNYTIIRAALAVDDGKVYVGLSNNFGYFDTDSTGRLDFYSLLELLPPDQRNIEEIWRIHQTSEGIVFQSFNNIIVLNEGKTKVYNAISKFHYSFHINNKLYVVDTETGILEFRNGKFSLLEGTEALLESEISAILPYGKDLMITTTDDGVFIYKDKEIKKWETPASEYLKENQIYCALRIDENQIAFGTIQKGLLISDNDGIPQIVMDKSKGLQNNTILSMKVDKSGNLWIGTDNGIDLLYINFPISQLSLNQGIGSGYSAIIHENILYLGTNQGVFYKKWKNRNDVHLDFSSFKLIKNTKGQVWSLQVIDGELFCGHNKGTFIIDGSKAKSISNVPGAWKFLQSEKNPDKIIGGTYNGLILLKKEHGEWIFKHKIKGFNESSRLMYFDSEEDIWMSHGFKGVFHITLNEQTDSVINVKFYNSKKGFRTDFGINISKLQGQIVFLSSEGVFIHNELNDTIIPSKYFNNFFSNLKVNNAIEDVYGNIWYYENFSLGLKLIKADGNYKDVTMPFKQLKGNFIEGFQFIYPINKNNYLISYENGFIHYNPSLLTNKTTPFDRYLNRVELSKSDSTIFKGHLFSDNEISPILDYNSNSLHFYYSAVDYENPDKVEFSTFLEGHDEGWSKWERRYDREFTNLTEGEYTFRLKGRDIHKSETEVLNYSFVISPPWKRTKAAYILYTVFVIMCISLITLIIKKRITQLKLREEKLQKQKFKVREEVFQREALKAEKEIIKLRNDNLRAQIKTKDKELANSTMLTIQKNKFLISLKNEMAKNNTEIINDIAKRHNRNLINKIDNEINNEKNWKVFETHFTNVHEEFLSKLKREYPQISPAELRLCACLRMNISSKEIASLLNISLRGVEASRYRLRKAIGLDRTTNLTDFILSF